MNNDDRLIGAFGKREMELAAICIVDYFKGRTNTVDSTIDVSIFKRDIEKAGFRLLKEHGWIVNLRPISKFWERVKEK